MWEWFLKNSLWFLAGSCLLVLLFFFFSEKVQSAIGRVEPEKLQKQLPGNIRAIFWTVELLALATAILAFIALVLSSEGAGVVITPAHIMNWFTEHGIENIVVILVGMVFWAILRRIMPALVENFMTKPRKGESREGLKRRAYTLRGVFLGLGRVIIILMVVLIVLSDYFDIGPILAGFGIVGIAVGFGAQYLVKDLIAGVFVLMENQYRVGDVAKVADVTGLVEEVNLRKTVLRDLDGVVHHVPNGEIRVASNFSRHFARVNLDIPVAYGTDLDFAINVINRVCKEMAEEEERIKVFHTVPQVLRVNKFGDSGIEIKITGDVKPLEQWRIMGEMRLRLKKVFDAEGIEIPWPHTKVYFGNKPGDKS
ncbi:mechanosensitive ion channel family protein [Chloroflexota bacterium]